MSMSYPPADGPPRIEWAPTVEVDQAHTWLGPHGCPNRVCGHDSGEHDGPVCSHPDCLCGARWST